MLWGNEMAYTFNDLPRGVTGKKLPADSVLWNMRKTELMELLRLAQHNYTVLMEFYSNAAKSSMDTQKKLDRIQAKLEKKLALNGNSEFVYVNGKYDGLKEAIEIVKKEMR